MPVYKDFICPGTADQKWIRRTLGSLKYDSSALWLMNRDEGEYRLYPVTLAAFDAWASSHPDYKHPVQFSNNVLVVIVMLPPHDGAAHHYARNHLSSESNFSPCPFRARR